MRSFIVVAVALLIGADAPVAQDALVERAPAETLERAACDAGVPMPTPFSDHAAPVPMPELPLTGPPPVPMPNLCAPPSLAVRVPEKMEDRAPFGRPPARQSLPTHPLPGWNGLRRNDLDVLRERYDAFGTLLNRPPLDQGLPQRPPVAPPDDRP